MVTKNIIACEVLYESLHEVIDYYLVTKIVIEWDLINHDWILPTILLLLQLQEANRILKL